MEDAEEKAQKKTSKDKEKNRVNQPQSTKEDSGGTRAGQRGWT